MAWIGSGFAIGRPVARKDWRSRPRGAPQFTGRLALSSACLLLGACQTLQPTTTLVGTGDAGRDVAAVQAAADAGGRVILRGSFNFGGRERVILRRDVQIVGEDAKISGGLFPFYSPVPDKLPPAAPGPKIAIRGVHFDGPTFAALNIGYASGLHIAGNRITDVKEVPLPLPGHPKAQGKAGIYFGTAWSWPQGKQRAYAPGVFTGRVVIENNVIEVQPRTPAQTLGYGIYGQWTTGIDALIAGNTVTGASRTDIETIDHYRGPAGEGRIRIAGNNVTTAEAGLPFPGANTPNAILVGYFSDRSAATDPTRNIVHDVHDNTIETRGSSSYGIAVIADGAWVKNNTITSRGESALPLLIVGSGIRVKGNTVGGRGTAGVTIPGGAYNELVDNDLGRFSGSKAQVVFGKNAADNLCAGHQFIIKISDEGLRNRCP